MTPTGSHSGLEHRRSSVVWVLQAYQRLAGSHDSLVAENVTNVAGGVGTRNTRPLGDISF